ncbi:MAG: hypothetical protein V8R83_09150 [Candidatus Gastranaerophilaceae bacterium]
MKQAAYALKDPIAQQQSKEKFKTEIVNAYTGTKATNDITPEKQTGEVMLLLDSKKMGKKAVEQKDDKSIVIEYGIKGERCKEF